MTEDIEKKIKQEAERLGMSIEKISDIDCPRGIRNPGMYFGAMLMGKFAHELCAEKIQALNFQIEWYDKELTKLKNSKGNFE